MLFLGKLPDIDDENNVIFELYVVEQKEKIWFLVENPNEDKNDSVN